MNSAYRVTNSLGVRFGIFSVYAEFPFRHCVSIFYSTRSLALCHVNRQMADDDEDQEQITRSKITSI